MAHKLIVERVQLKTLQRYYHQFFNTFGEHETLIEAISNRPGFLGANPIAFLSIMARRSTLEAKDLDEAIIIDKTLIRVPAFRGSLFLIPTEDYPLYFRAFFQYLDQRKWQKLENSGFNRQKVMRLKETLFESPARWPLSLESIIDILFPLQENKPFYEILQLILQKLCDLGLLIRASSKGWKSNNFTFAPIQKWVPELSLKADNPETARIETIRRYLRAYGPSSIADIVWWTGLSLSQCQRSISHLKKEIIRFNVENHSQDMLALKESIDNIRKKASYLEEIQLLPPWDPYALGWHSPTRLAEADLLPFIYDQKGNPTSIIVDQGKIIGLWQLREEETTILEYHIFKIYDDRKKAVLQKMDEWANALMKFNGAETIYIIEKDLSLPLIKRPPGSVLWPLGKEINKKKPEIISPMERRSNTFRQPYLDNRFLVRPSGLPEKAI